MASSGFKCIQKKTIAFQEQLRETGRYSTERSKKRFYLPSFLATPIFAMKMGKLFVKTSLHAHQPDFMEKRWSVFGMYVMDYVEKLGGHIELDGFEEISKLGRPAVWVSNHMSALETYMFPPILMSWPGLAIILKEDLAHYPFFGKVVKAIDPIRIQRKNPITDLRKVLDGGKKAIEAGRSVLVFPQGRRERLFEPASFNSLGTKLAQNAKAPIIPIAVATDFLRIGKKHRDVFASVHIKSPVRVSCGPAIPCDLPRTEIQNRCIDFISSKLTEWEKLDNRKMLADGKVEPK